MQENSSHSSQLKEEVSQSLLVLCDTEQSQFNALAQRIPFFSFDIEWKINAWGCLLEKVTLLQSHLQYMESNRGQNPKWEVDNPSVIFIFFSKDGLKWTLDL